jgi:lysozyme
MASKPQTNKPVGAAIGAAMAVMVAIATPFYTGWEGVRTTAYRDIVGVWTICAGDTRNVSPGMRVTMEECNRRTAAIMDEFGESVRRDSPTVVNHPHIWASLTSFAANVGKAGYRNSSVRRLYDAGQYRAACRRMRAFRLAGGRVVQGLINRREGTDDRMGEYELCLADAIRLELGTFQ